MIASITSSSTLTSSWILSSYCICMMWKYSRMLPISFSSGTIQLWLPIRYSIWRDRLSAIPAVSLSSCFMADIRMTPRVSDTFFIDDSSSRAMLLNPAARTLIPSSLSPTSMRLPRLPVCISIIPCSSSPSDLETRFAKPENRYTSTRNEPLKNIKIYCPVV